MVDEAVLRRVDVPLKGECCQLEVWHQHQVLIEARLVDIERVVNAEQVDW